MSPLPSASARSARRGLLSCLLLLLLAKSLIYAVDPNARVFLGDSASYLHTALSGWIPPDRSFLYGWLIGATALPAGSIQSLLQLQSAFGVISALLLYAWLVFGLRCDARIAMAGALLLALEPAQLFFERMMMAEAPGFLTFALFFSALSLHVARGGWIWIALYAVLGVLTVGFRISLMPVVLVLCAIAPLVRFVAMDPDRRRSWLRRSSLVVSLLLALGATWYAHDWYKHWYGELKGSAPGYTASTGMFRLGLVVPLVERQHFSNSGVSPEVLDEVTLDLRDPRLRESHLWVEGGLYDVIRRHTNDPETAARKISIKAVRDNPFGLVRLGIGTLGDYFDSAVYLHRVQDDMGWREPHREFRDDLKRYLDYDAGELHRTATPVSRWFAWGTLWLTACLFLLVPLAIVGLIVGWHAPGRGLRWLLALTSIGLVTGHVLFSHIVSFRYLHPLPWFVLANAALLLQAWHGARTQGVGGERNTQKRELR